MSSAVCLADVLKCGDIALDRMNMRSTLCLLFYPVSFCT